MENRCIDCPKTKEYLDIGLSPCCGGDRAATVAWRTETGISAEQDILNHT